MIDTSYENKHFYKTMISIALPIAMQNLISSSLTMVDTIMIGRLGEASIAAVGLGNQFFFFFSLLLFGINSGSAIFIAQFWGKKDIKNIRRILGIAILSGGIISILFTLAALLFPVTILKFFTNDPVVIKLGSQFLRILSLSFTITTISTAFGQASRCIGQAKVPMFISGISLLINTVLNIILIYGKLGLPALGVRGTAIATDIARIVELTLMLLVVYRKGGVLAAKISELVDLSSDFIKKFFKTALPVIMNEGLWSLGITMYSAAYARIGTGAVAAVQISNTIQNLFMTIFFGLGNACAVMIGNQIGSGKKDTAISYSKKYSIITPVSGIIMGMLLLISRPAILSLFNVAPEVYNDVNKILMIFSLILFIKAYNIITVVGILRSGGDTKVALFLDTGGIWLIGVPLSFIGALVWKLPVYYVVALVSIEEIFKFILGTIRVVSKKWVRNVIEHM